MSLISLGHVVKKYHVDSLTTTVINDVSFAVNQGDMLAIVGVSGSGKSTLMNIIGLLDSMDSGQYFLDSRNVAGLSADELASLRNQYIGFVFQQFNLLTRLSALQNVALPLSYRDNLTSAQIKQQAMKALERVGMGAYAERRPNQLSGGQQQRIAIARALVGEPHIILADEPTGALDSVTGNEIFDLFHLLHQEGRTIIIVTHDAQIAAQCTRCITIADGRIKAESNR